MFRRHVRPTALDRAGRAAIETLEYRLHLATDTWNWIAGPGDWGNRANWSTSAPIAQTAPDFDDVVSIPASAGTVTVGGASFKTATIGADVRILGAGTMNVYERLTMNGTLTVVGGGQFITRCLFHAASSILDGNGTITFENGGGAVGTNSTLHSLSIGSELTIRTNSSSGSFNLNGQSQVQATVIVDGSSLTFEGTGFTSRGLITVNNTGNLRFIAARWTNLGTVTMNGGTWTLGGTFRQADLGRHIRNAGTITVSAGTVDGNLNLNPTTGSWVSNNARLRNGRYTSSGGAVITGGLTLDNYILGSNLTPTGGLSVANDLTLEGATLSLNSIDARFSSTTSTVRGNGTIQFSNGSISMFQPSSVNLTIESGITLRTVGGNMSIGGNFGPQRLAFMGPVIVSASGQTFNLSVPNADFYNEVSLASGASLVLPGGNTGTLNFLPGSSLVTGSRTQISTPKSINFQAQNPGRKHAPGIVAMNGGTAATPLLYEVAGRDLGPNLAGYRENFAVGVFRSSTSNSYIRLVNNHDNAPGPGPEALYADAVIISGSMTLDLNGLNLYTRSLESAGTVVNGTITLLPDGGPIEFALPTSGRISTAGQLDNWTFFGRAGQIVSGILNPGSNPSSSAPAPVNPTLGTARFTLLAPDGSSLGAAQSVGLNAPATLSNIVLPADGTYTLRVQAPLNDPNRTGHYKLALYNVTADERPLLLNRPTSGAIETPFSSDRWTLSLSAGQQVQFDLLSADVNGLQFTLEGPNGYVAFNDLTNDSTLITIPPGNRGNYVLTVKGSSDQTGRYSFLVRDTSVTPLTLGVPFAGELPGSGSPRWFKATLPVTGQLLVTLDDANNADRNQLYIRRGSPPTRELFDFRYSSYDADEQIYIPNASPGDWYILVYGDHVPAPSTYTLTAEFSDLRITSNTPDRYGVGNTTTMTIIGGGFEPGTTVRLAGGASTILASSVEVDTSTQLTATFNLTGAPLRAWDLVVERATLSFTRPSAFTTLPNLPAKLETKLIMPAFPTRVSASVGRVEYANTGNVAMPAPLFIVQSNDPEGDQFPILSLDMNRTIQDFWAAVLPPGTSHRLMMLGSGAVPGVLNPGERMSIPYNYLGEKAPFEPSDENLELELLCVHDEGESELGQQQVNWSALKSGLKPPGIPNAIWDQVYSTITDPLNTIEDYASALAANAQYLGRIGARVVDVDDIWNFQVQQALGVITAIPTLASSVDAQLPAPGDPLTLGRRFADGVVNRNTLGPFGYGWWSPWFATLSRDANNNVVTINGSSGGQRVFVRDGRGSTPLSPSSAYFSSAGDSSRLRRIGSNVFELRDVGGVVTRFRSDGKLDYLQDANGNRTTLSYNGDGELVTLTHTSGATINLGYNAAGRITTLTDSLGRSKSYTYDPTNEHLLSVGTAGGGLVAYTYEPTASGLMRRHALLSESTAGRTLLYTYDAQGRVASTFIAGGAQPISFSYDFGRITLSDASGTGSFFYDHRLRVRKVTNPLGYSSRMIYDADNRLTTIILPDETRQHYAWCDCGSLISVTDELGRTVRTTRDPLTRNVTSITDPKGNVSQYTYDAKGNTVSLVYPDGTSEFAGNYTTTGLPQAFTTRGGKVMSVVYNPAGQITQRTASDGSVTNYTYDSRGRLTTIVGGGETITRTYDTVNSGDRLKRITYPGGRFVEYDYDSLGRQIAQRDQTGNTTRYEYDAAGRLAHVRDTGGATLASYTYDASDRLGRVDKGNGTFTTYTYDAGSNLLAIRNWRSAGQINSQFLYAYDKRGRRISATTSDGTWTYTYDPAGQLTGATLASTNPQIADQTIQINYDAAGNRAFVNTNGVLIDYVSNALNQYTQVDGTDYSYDADGNLLSDGARQFTYDVLNRLVQVESGGDTQQFEYNAAGGRDASVVNGVRTNFLLAPDVGGTVLAEYDASGILQARNIYGAALLGRSDAAGTLRFHDFDLLGSTAGLTGADGSYANRYAFDPFGNTLLTSESASNPYRFTGQLGARAGIGGLTRMGLRDYAAGIGRFTTVDPLRLADHTNAYQYAGNSPMMNVDPSGLFIVSLGPAGGKGLFTGIVETNVDDLGDLVFSVGVDAWQGLAIAAQTGKLPDVQDAGWATLSSFALNAGFSAPGFGGFANGFQVAMDPEVNQHFVNAACGLALQREFGTINLGAAKQLAALEAESGGAGPSTVNAACLEGFPQSGDADFGIGDRCGGGVVSLAPRPLDPNEKKPNRGFGPQNRVAIERPVEYTVDFENLGPGSVDENGDPYPVVAAVPAQRVAIDDQLSPHLDWSTVRFTEFAFGDAIVPVTDGFGSFSAIVPVETNGVAYTVQIDAFVDLDSGVLSVIFQAIDPLTGLPPTAPVGVVAPEDGGGNGMGHFKFSVTPLQTLTDGTEIRNVAIIQFDANDVIPTNQINPLDPASGTDPAREALVTIDNAPPGVIGEPEFVFDAATPRITVQFSEDVSPSLETGDVLIENLTTSVSVSAVAVAFDANTNTATFVLAPALPDGNYRLTLPAGAIADGVGYLSNADATAEFYHLAGDANRDRSVAIADFAILAANLNQPGTFTTGDFTYSGTVEIGDFAILASKYNTTLPPAARTPGVELARPGRPPAMALPARRAIFSTQPVVDLLEI